MPPHLKTTSVLAPVALVALLAGLPSSAWRWPLPEGRSRAQPVHRQVPAATRDFCGRAAFLLYDVTWAAACEARGEDEECTLPDDVAAKVNAIPTDEEQRCVAAELQADTASPR